MTEYNKPYTTAQRIINIVFNFLAAVGFIAFAAGIGYLWARFV